MIIHARITEYESVKNLRDLYRQEANCQVVHDSFLARALAVPYLLLIDGRIAGYAAVGNKYPAERAEEFYVLPHHREHAGALFSEMLSVSRATSIVAQTNIPQMLTALYDHATNITTEAIIFADARITNLPCPDGVTFRHSSSKDKDALFEHKHEPEGDWILEQDGSVVATGGFLCHYNPPYGDIYMEVVESARRKGYGSYLIQEIKRMCYESGKKPSARCNPANIASRATLQKAGFIVCGRILSGDVVGDIENSIE